MRNIAIIMDLLKNIEEALSLVIDQTKDVASADGFLCSPSGVFKLDGACMNLMAVGEAVKNLDKFTEQIWLPKYPSIDWKGFMRLRDIIAHQYFDVDAERVFEILREEVPPLLNVIRQMQIDISKESQ